MGGFEKQKPKMTF